MPMEAGAIGIRPINQPQRPGSSDGVQRREDGGSGSGFRPQTSVAIKTAIDDMAGVLSKISTNEKLSMERLPEEVSQVVKNILQQAFSMESTLSQGIGSTLESQRFSMEQLSVFARMLTQIGALAEKGFSMELSDQMELILKNLKSLVVNEEGGSTFEPVLLSKAAFELIDSKNAEQLPQQLYELLAALSEDNSSMNMNQSQLPQSDSMNFLKQLVKYFMPKPMAGDQNVPQEGQAQQLNQRQTAQSQARQFLQSMFGNLKSQQGQSQQPQSMNQNQPQSNQAFNNQQPQQMQQMNQNNSTQPQQLFNNNQQPQQMSQMNQNQPQQAFNNQQQPQQMQQMNQNQPQQAFNNNQQPQQMQQMNQNQPQQVFNNNQQPQQMQQMNQNQPQQVFNNNQQPQQMNQMNQNSPQQAFNNQQPQQMQQMNQNQPQQAFNNNQQPQQMQQMNQNQPQQTFNNNQQPQQMQQMNQNQPQQAFNNNQQPQQMQQMNQNQPQQAFNNNQQPQQMQQMSQNQPQQTFNNQQQPQQMQQMNQNQPQQTFNNQQQPQQMNQMNPNQPQQTFNNQQQPQQMNQMNQNQPQQAFNNQQQPQQMNQNNQSQQAFNNQQPQSNQAFNNQQQPQQMNQNQPQQAFNNNQQPQQMNQMNQNQPQQAFNNNQQPQQMNQNQPQQTFNNQQQPQQMQQMNQNQPQQAFNNQQQPQQMNQMNQNQPQQIFNDNQQPQQMQQMNQNNQSQQTFNNQQPQNMNQTNQSQPQQVFNHQQPQQMQQMNQNQPQQTFNNQNQPQQSFGNSDLQAQQQLFSQKLQAQLDRLEQGDDFLAKQQQLKTDIQAAKTVLLKQPLQNTPQTMDAMRQLANLIVKNPELTHLSERDTAALQDFVNNNQAQLSEGEARHLQNLLRLCQQNVPITVQQAAVQQKLPDLTRLWAFMQLCDMAPLTSKLSAKAFKRAGRDVAEFANAMRQSMGGDNSSVQNAVQNNRSLQMMMPLYVGDNDTSYPTYLHVYDENERDKETGEEKKETWLRICVLTDYIGAVELTFRMYEGNQLDLRFYFSERSAASEFRNYIPSLKEKLKETTLNVGEVRIGSVGQKMMGEDS